MDEHDVNELLWRSCYLGMRIAIQSLPPSERFEKIKECVRFLGEIAHKETTLYEPQHDLAGSDPETKRLFLGIGNQTIIADRDLAPLILAGMNHAATVPEEPAAFLPLHADHPPIRVDEGGAIRVGKSRISLDLIVEQYENGMTPEDMVRAYDTLVLADIHSVIAYYLRHRDEVRVYLKQRTEEAAALRTKIETERPRVSREELLARRRVGGKTNAPTGQ